MAPKRRASCWRTPQARLADVDATTNEGETVRAVTLLHGKLELRNIPSPEPGTGQVLVRTLACAVCASDHHYMDHPQVSRADQSGMRVDAPDSDVIMGHEYCAEVVAYGPDTQRAWPIGTRVTSPPALLGTHGMRIIGMAPDAPGGFGEYFLLSEFLARAVPDDVPAERIALTDAMAVGWYYSRLGVEHTPNGVPLVLGLGAIGQSVVAALRKRGSGPIVAADFSASRRELAREMGADVVVNPADESPWSAWRRVAWGAPDDVHDRMALFGRPSQVVYEMVGRNGVLGDVIDHCQIGARILSCGGASEDTIHTTTAHMKGVNIQIGGGPMPDDWYACLDLVIGGELDPTPLIGETVPLEDLADAIERARSASAPVRILYTAT
jgi:threonine dehydrogenase-like Zn-dependent dehydrogenase